ncbi:hypothetical protein JCM18903_3137 [Psychrobacter sp. JCM 18903]|uniref:Lipoprotein n=2 Tax=Moraxellaceae TaxID=468 RepID=A0A2V1ZZ17_PSYIM|nr:MULTISPECIES: hypothetical protein [Psychrobacter]MCG3808050.1 hypothetical protein [Psychrobacter sp. Ps4]MDN5561838.1 hypothetical protein [Psychrobacter sp.]PWK14633.1 hypothetical protein C8D84_102108 [Psychrobacter immobilis]GAF63017.1 hypothetical protein JCM18903_3137 [Psychrobacter sp. JCM 18903]
MIMSPPRAARHSRFFSVFFTTSAALFALSGCNNMTPSVNHQAIKQPIADVMPAVQAVVGDYADEGYEKRAQGYDWVGVMVRAESDQQINIKVRARSDIKKPSCQFDSKATLMGQDDAHGIIFQSKVNDSTAFFQFKDDKLTIDSQDKYALNYFCSGGGTLIGDYQKLTTDLEI